MRLKQFMASWLAFALTFLALPFPARPEAPTTSTTRQYSITRQVTSSTANTITVRQPATSGRTLHLLGFYVQCSAACTVTLNRAGTLSSGSAGTILSLDDRASTVTSAATYDGTVTSPTTVISPVSIAAGGSQAFGGGLTLSWDGSTRKLFTIDVQGSSGTITVFAQFEEL